MAAVVPPGPTARSLRLVLRVLGLVLLGTAVLELVLLADAGIAPLWVLALFVGNGLVWAGAGLLAWSRRPSNRTGPLLVSGGCAFLLAVLSNTAPRPLAAVGALVAVVPLAVAVHLVLAFPSGRVRGRGARLTTVAAYVLALVSPLPADLFTPGSPLAVADRPDLAALSDVLRPLGGLVPVAAAVVVVGRLRRCTPAQRWALGPLYAYGVAAVLAVSSAARLQELLGISDLLRVTLQLAAVSVIPVAFAAVLLRGGFARAGEVEELGTLLGQQQAPAQEVLAQVLGDPSLQLLHWLPAERSWVDGDGRPWTAPDDPSRGLVEVTVGGRRRGALSYDAGLIPDPDLVRAAARPAGLALEAERLTVELRRSRARLVAAADDERRRLARDLHDGLQVRLVLLAVEAGTLASSATGPGTAQALERLRREVDDAAAELRRTVQSLLPAALVERGLPAAVEDLVDRLPLPARLEVHGVPERLEPDVVATAWYVVTEALANALKHAQASRVDVHLSTERGELHVEVADDGAGGASLQQGTGLRGLVDRLDVVGGRLRVTSDEGAGTRVCAAIPCSA